MFRKNDESDSLRVRTIKNGIWSISFTIKRILDIKEYFFIWCVYFVLKNSYT